MTRRTPRPHEIARRDQALAAARAEAALPGHTVIVVDDADPGATCSLCDCPSPLDDPASPHHDPAYRCGGCPLPAAVTFRVPYGTPQQVDAPVCAAHKDAAHNTLRRTYQRIFKNVTFAIAPESGWVDPE